MYKILLAILCSCPLLANYEAHKKWVHDSYAENMHRFSPNSLNRYGKNVCTQFGEDGIIEEIFSRIGIENGFFVDFGANDGIWFSNTRHLWEKGWHGVMIEANAKFYKQLHKTYLDDPRVLTLKEFVTWKKNDKRGKLFSEIRKKHFPNKEIDFLSIDIDGGDYFILKTLQCRPKVICIENGQNWHPLMQKEVAEKTAVKNIHQPLGIVIKYAEKIGYRAVCATINLFLVREDFAHLFEDVPGDAVTLYRDAFRALPNKKWVLEDRSRRVITSFENSEFQKNMPITMEF